MRAILSFKDIDILRTRTFIARHVHILDLNDIAQEWEMSRMTLYRYDSDIYRAYSRFIVKNHVSFFDTLIHEITPYKLAGWNSGQIAFFLNIPLSRVNKIYSRIPLLHVERYTSGY